MPDTLIRHSGEVNSLSLFEEAIKKCSDDLVPGSNACQHTEIPGKFVARIGDIPIASHFKC